MPGVARSKKRPRRLPPQQQQRTQQSPVRICPLRNAARSAGARYCTRQARQDVQFPVQPGSSRPERPC